MGKKQISKASSRICKNNNEKQKLSSCMKVLRPKVYIIDSSNFKSLVQELTGNSNVARFTASLSPEKNEEAPVVDVTTGEESSMEGSADESLNSWNQLLLLNEEIDQSWNQIYEDVTAFDSSIHQQKNLPDVSEIESWLLDDIDHDDDPLLFSCFDDGFIPLIENEITSFAGHCQSSELSLEQQLANPILDSFSYNYNDLYKF